MNKPTILLMLFCLVMFGLARGGPGDEATRNTLLSGEKLTWQVVTASGGTATGGGFTLSSSLGQTAVGKSTSPSFHLVQGFLQNFGTTVAPCTGCGDANNDGGTDISDVVYLIAYIFSGGAVPGDCSVPQGLGDANGSSSVDISDVVYVIAYIFSGGLAPHCP